MNVRGWRWTLIAVGLALSTLIAGCGCAPAPPPRNPKPSVPKPPTCLNDRSATILLQREGKPDSYRRMTVESTYCQGGWAVGTLVLGSDGMGSVLYRAQSGRWNFVYGAGSFWAFCQVARDQGAPKWALTECVFN